MVLSPCLAQHAGRGLDGRAAVLGGLQGALRAVQCALGRSLPG
ncbi:hypothetical protein OTB19_22375 [Streptomyces sp. H27-H5]|nr:MULTISPECIES: hypothetical protein [unclassified Streptomyces]MCY0919594.1 hypothetical protein [Streptomyces sp. H27-G5]MCY0959654.1 hypothetical protein [Streptomyces sp. H27-H5]